MHVEIKRTELIRVLSTVAKAVESRNTIPILANVLLTATDGRLSIRGTNLDIDVQANCDAIVMENGATTVDAKKLTEIAKKAAGESVNLNMSGSDLSVSSGRSQFKLHTLPADDFPILTDAQYPHRFKANLADLFSRVAFAISTEETRYYLNGIYLHVHQDGDFQLRAVATDGHRLARADAPLPEAIDGHFGVIVPSKTVALISSLKGDVDVEVSSTKIRVTAADVVLTSKLIDGTFPDYGRVVPKNNDRRLVIERKALAAVVDRVSTISSNGGRAVKLAFSNGRLALSMSNPDSGSASEELDVGYVFDPMEIGFNSRYLLDILKLPIGERVEVMLSNADSPTIFQSIDGENDLFVLMPMRI